MTTYTHHAALPGPFEVHMYVAISHFSIPWFMKYSLTNFSYSTYRVSRLNGTWNGGIVERATMTNDPVPHHLFVRAQYASHLQLEQAREKNRSGDVDLEEDRGKSRRAHADSLAIDVDKCHRLLYCYFQHRQMMP